MINPRISTLVSIADAGWEMVRGRFAGRRRTVEALAIDLVSNRGEASGLALARELVESFRRLPPEGRLDFYRMLARDLGLNRERAIKLLAGMDPEPSLEQLGALREALEPPRQELFRRMNMAPDGTRALVKLREDLLGRLKEHPELAEVDADLFHLMSSWFNVGFLRLARIDWHSPASLLEKLIRYEKVHKIPSLEALRRRLAEDRRCFAFFHPALPDEPLIFVQVALVKSVSSAIGPLIDPEQGPAPVEDADTAIFYSISNCQDGLRGVSLGNFLIKRVVAEIHRDLPQLKTFATLSPIPGFARWARRALEAGDPVLGEAERGALEVASEDGWWRDEDKAQAARGPLLSLAAHYLTRAKRGERPSDPVARFHLGNGARLDRLNWLGDLSAKGMRESYGMLVNYRYDLGTIERNHEAFVNHGTVATSSAVRGLLPPDPAKQPAKV